MFWAWGPSCCLPFLQGVLLSWCIKVKKTKICHYFKQLKNGDDYIYYQLFYHSINCFEFSCCHDSAFSCSLSCSVELKQILYWKKYFYLFFVSRKKNQTQNPKPKTTNTWKQQNVQCVMGLRGHGTWKGYFMAHRTCHFTK